MPRRPRLSLLLAATALALSVGCATSEEHRYGADIDNYEVRVGKSMSARYARPWYGGEHKLKIERTTPNVGGRAGKPRETLGAGADGAQ